MTEAEARPNLPRLVTDIALDQPTPDRLLAAVAETLGVPQEEIQLFDSFADLGGNEQAARAVRQTCRRKGMNVSVEHIMKCHTLAELQTHVKPSPAQQLSVSPITPEAESSGPEGSYEASSESNPSPNPDDDDLLSPGRRGGGECGAAADSYTETPRTSSDTDAMPRHSDLDLESFLLSTSRVGKVCLVKPKAGPLDGQLVALVTLAAVSPKGSKEISLPPASEHEAHQKHVCSLTTALLEWGSDAPRPQIWISLKSMALNREGNPDARRLQTWVQNINEEVHGQIMKLQAPEPKPSRDARAQGGEEKKKKLTSWPECRASMLRGDQTGRIDWEDPALEASDEIEFFPLSAMQQLYFRTSMNRSCESSSIGDAGYRFSQSLTLRLSGGTELADIEAAVEALVARHAMLRARFRLTDEGWAQIILPRASNSYRFGHHNARNDEEVASLTEQAQAVIHPTDGPVFAAEHVRTADNEQYLYLVAHHLVVDLISWRIMAYDLDELLQQGSLLSERSIPFPHWIDYQGYEMSERLVEPILPFDITPANLEYWDLDQYSNHYGDTEQRHFSLTPELSSILQTTCNRVFRTESSDVFLAALLLSFTQAFPDRKPPTVWRQESGRDCDHPELNIMETVGWFTSLCPISVGADSTADILELLKLIKDTRRAIPRNGVPYFVSEFSVSQGPLPSIPVEVMFNCIDSLQQLRRKDGVLEPVPVPGQNAQALTSDIGGQVGRIALFEMSVAINDAGARVECLYNQNSRHHDRIGMWMQGFEHLVLEAIGRLRFHEPELTLSDVPLLKTSYEELAKLGTERLQGLELPGVRDVETMYPVTPAQQEILVAQSQSPESFHVHATYELKTKNGTPIDSSRLCAAWESIVAAQPVLKSIFIDSVSEEGLFDQVVLKKTSPSMLFIDSPEPEVTLAKLPSMRTRPAEPRHRLSVCRSASKTFVRVDASQAICDSSSIHNLMAELSRVYSGGSPSTNEALLHTYLYHVSSLDASYSLEAWTVDLVGAQPCYFPRLTAQPTEQVQQQASNLELTQAQIDAFCQEREIYPEAVFKLAWALVLRSFVGMDQVSFGYEFPGRDTELLPGIDGAIGSFATNLPCSVTVSPSQTIAQCLEYLSEASVSAKQHQNLTTAEIQHALGIRGGPLFNTCLSFDDSDLESGVFRGEDIGELKPALVHSARISDCNLSLAAVYVKGILRVSLGARNLSSNQAQNVIGTFEQTLKVILETPALSIAEVDLFTDRDYAQLVVQDWESSQRLERVASCLHLLILSHAQTTPEAPAVCSWDGDMSYRQLLHLVSRLRTYLVNLGVGPGTVVPVVLEKSRWVPVIMLAVLQAGACFVALDSQDKVTVESTIRQLNPQIVLATETAWKDLGTVVLNLIIVDGAFFATLPLQMSSLAQGPTPEHAACVFMSPSKTRGGASRNIFFSHASLCSAFAAQGPALKLNDQSRVLQLSAFNVDIALVEILGTMLHGGCVCIPSPHERVHDLAGAISKMNVTWTYMTGILSRKISPASVPSLKTLCFRTRKLDRDTYEPWLENRDVLLAYGAPDVCPLGISVTEVTKHKDLRIIPPPLTGRFWVLNADDPKKLMPIGAVGELAIDSPIVTPHRFVPGGSLVAPVASQSPVEKPKSRYLKTGHRVRYLDDGNIQFISSVRDEVLIDGAIVDISEVEQQMRRCLGQGIDVAVEAVTTRDSVRVLAGFLELGGHLFQGPEDFDQLSPAVKEQAFICRTLVQTALSNPQSRLPAHHIPSVFIPLKHFPISASLKVNRRRLQRKVAWLSYSQLNDLSTVPSPADVQLKATSQKPLPLTQGEETLREIWAQVLGISPSCITASDSFFSAGGDTFLAAEVAVACRKAGAGVSIRDILRGVTLSEISRAMDAPESLLSETRSPVEQGRVSFSQSSSSLAGFDPKFISDIIAPQVGVAQRDITDVAEASAHQIRSLELGVHDSRADITCLVLNFNGPIRHQKLASACEDLAQIHPMLRTAFAVHDRRVYQVLLGSFKPTFERYPTPAWRIDSVTENMVKQDQGLAFNPNKPVTRFTFVDAGQQGNLIVRLSKSQIDDASVSLLVQDLISLYDDSASALPRSSFFDYMRAATAANYTEGIDHWKDLLDGAKMTQIISHPKPYSPTRQVKTIEETIRVNSLGGFGMALDTVVKAAWAVVLATVSGSHDVLFGEVVQGHNVRLPDSVDLMTMVGPLANTIPVRVCFPTTHSTPIDLMQYVQGQRSSNRRYEAAGILELVHQCTKWSYWTRLSTVVHHRPKRPFDGVTTLNMGSTTFTYNTVEPELQDLPDLLVCSTVESPERLKLAIKFAEGRVSNSFAEDALKLLISAVRMLTCFDTVTRPMLQSSDEIARSAKQVPLPNQPAGGLITPVGHLLPHDQRVSLQTFITAAWTKVLDPKPLGVPEAQMHKASFYDLWGTLLPAYFFADYFNRHLPGLSLKVPGLETVRVTPEDIIDNPTMLAQFELVVRKIREGGVIPAQTRRKTMSFRSDSTSHGSTTWSPKTNASSSSNNVPTWKDSIRKLRNHDSKTGMRSLSIKAAGGWMKHRVSSSWDGSLRDAKSREPVIREGQDVERKDSSEGSTDKIVEEVEVSPLSATGGEGSRPWVRSTTSPTEVSPLKIRALH